MYTTIQQGTTEHIDPTTPVIEANVLPSAPLTNDFINSNRDNRVLTPVLARKDGKGNVLVRAGQRCTPNLLRDARGFVRKLNAARLGATVALAVVAGQECDPAKPFGSGPGALLLATKSPGQSRHSSCPIFTP